MSRASASSIPPASWLLLVACAALAVGCKEKKPPKGKFCDSSFPRVCYEVDVADKHAWEVDVRGNTSKVPLALTAKSRNIYRFPHPRGGMPKQEMIVVDDDTVSVREDGSKASPTTFKRVKD